MLKLKHFGLQILMRLLIDLHLQKLKLIGLLILMLIGLHLQMLMHFGLQILMR